MGVRRKAAIIGTLALLLTAATRELAPDYGRAVSSVRTFQRNFGDLKKAGSMSPMERFVFSLVLTSSKAPTTANDSYVPPAGRT